MTRRGDAVAKVSMKYFRGKETSILHLSGHLQNTPGDLTGLNPRCAWDTLCEDENRFVVCEDAA